MADRRPSILYIMSDDHAANAISAYGSLLASVFQTPHMDRLAAEGVRLNNFFSTNSICTPARATILTGQYGHINGVRTLADALRPDYRPNLAVLLQQAGYETALFGKWHLHCEPVGFDEYKYMSGFHEQGSYQNPEFRERGQGVVHYEGYVTDIITDMARRWLRRRKDADKPDQCCNGYTILWQWNRVHLIDMNGRSVNEWRFDSEPDRPGADRARLLPSGNVLVQRGGMMSRDGLLQEYDWEHPDLRIIRQARV